KGATAGSDPIGLSGPIIYKMGAEGNELMKSFTPTQIQFSLRDTSDLLSRLRGASQKDFKLVIKENSEVLFHGYFLLGAKKRTLYEPAPSVDVRAFDGL